MPSLCPTCEADNPIVNYCGCDPDNLPTVATSTEEARLLLDHAIYLGRGRYEIPSISFVAATQLTRKRLPNESLPPD